MRASARPENAVLRAGSRKGQGAAVAAELRHLASLLQDSGEGHPETHPAPRRGRGSPARRSGHPGRFLVLCRFRPLLDEEERCHAPPVWRLEEDAVEVIRGELPTLPAFRFVFDHVFGPRSAQSEVFAEVAPLVRDALDGVNCAVLCYGQTAAGKTFTMEGPSARVDPQTWGIVQRTLSTLFAAAKAPGAAAVQLHLSMVEVYLDQVIDVLGAPGAVGPLQILVDRQGRSHVKGVREVALRSLDEALQVYEAGRCGRAVAATGLNERSSRSHLILTLRVERPGSVSSRLTLTDLAGSECLKKSLLRGVGGANDSLSKEAKAINRSLSALGLIIQRLAAGRARPGTPAHVPYRTSKLTRLLQETLSGDARSVLILNCSPSRSCVADTLSTLRLGVCTSQVPCASVGGGAHVSEDRLVSVLRAARSEIERLRGARVTAPSPLPSVPSVRQPRLRGGAAADVSPERSPEPVPPLRSAPRLGAKVVARDAQALSPAVAPMNCAGCSSPALERRSVSSDRTGPISIGGSAPRSCAERWRSSGRLRMLSKATPLTPDASDVAETLAEAFEDEDPSEKAAEDLLAWEAPAPLGGDGRQDAWEYPLTSSDCRRRAMRRALGEVARLRRGRPTAPESAHEEWLAWLSSASVSEWEP